MKIRFGVGLGVGQSLDTPAQLGDVVDLLEALGFDSLWMSDRVTGGALDPIAALAFAAGRTTKLKLGTNVLVLPGRDPFLMARQLAAVDQLSGGRLLPAVGLGSPSKADRPPFGVPKGTRAQRFEDGRRSLYGREGLKDPFGRVEGVEIEEGEFRIKGYDGPIVECEKCGSEMHLKMGRFGKYMACTNDECKNTRKILRNGEVAPPKEDPVPLPELPCEKSDAYFVLRDGAAGVFLAANTFPKSRETRAPLVEELYRFRDRLAEKLRYLADAPQQDPEGNKTMVRFSRKTKQQYVASEKDGKATGWSAFYIDGKWTEAKK